MKRFLAVLTFCLFAAGIASADEGKPMTNQGNAAWMFSFSGLSNFGLGGLFTVSGPSLTMSQDVHNPGSGNSPYFLANNTTTVPGVGLRYYLANNMALRGGLGLGILSSSTKNGSNPDNTASGMELGIQAILEWHLAPVGAVSPYLGGGIGFQTASYTTKNYSGPSNSDEVKNSNTSLGIQAVAGFEWFFTNRVSLGGEYSLGFASASGSTTDTPSSGSSTTMDKPSSTVIGTSAFSVLLSLYP